MGEDKLGIELISKDATINTLLPIMSELSIDVDAQEKIVLAIMNQKIAYDMEKVVAELEQQAEQYRNRGFEHEQKGFSKMADKYYGKQCSYLHAIDIVKRGGVE